MDEGVIYGYGAVPPNIDSMKIGDSLLYGEDFFDYNYDEEYHENYWEVYFDEGGSEYMYEHGDTAVVRFYGNGRTSMSRFKILDADSAELEWISPAYDEDTITATDTVTAYWHKSDGADYYSIFLEFVTGDDQDWWYEYYYTLDTTFTVLPDLYPDSLRRFYINVTPFTGPDPRTGGSNVTGNYLTGKMYSFGWYDYTRVQGWYPPAGSGSAGLTADEPDRKKPSAAEMVAKVYELYR